MEWKNLSLVGDRVGFAQKVEAKASASPCITARGWASRGTGSELPRRHSPGWAFGLFSLI